MTGNSKHSPIIEAIRSAEAGTTGEIRVHLSKRLIERDPYRRAVRLFHRFGMTKTAQHNAVLLYVNLRKHKFAIVGDTGVHKAVGQRYWESLVQKLRHELRSTHPENAIATAVTTIGESLKKFFPLEPGEDNPNELEDELSED